MCRRSVKNFKRANTLLNSSREVKNAFSLQHHEIDLDKNVGSILAKTTKNTKAKKGRSSGEVKRDYLFR